MNPLSDKIQAVNAEVWTYGSKVAVDEIMVQFEGKAKEATTIPNKPNPTGFKVWALVVSSGSGIGTFRARRMAQLILEHHVSWEALFETATEEIKHKLLLQNCSNVFLTKARVLTFSWITCLPLRSFYSICGLSASALQEPVVLPVEFLNV